MESGGDDSRRARWLLLAAAVLFVTAAFYTFVVPLTPGRSARASAELVSELALWRWVTSLGLPVPGEPGVAAVALVAAALAVFGAWGLSLWLCWDRPAGRRSVAVVVLAALALFSLGTLALPNLNTDIYHYILQARVASEHGENPLYVPANRFPDDPLHPYASARWTALVGDKMAVWMWICIPLARLAGDDPVTSLLAFRAAFLAFNVANLLLVGGILRRLAPRHLLAGLVFYGWNPIIFVTGESKTDTAMVSFWLLATWLLVRERPRLAVVSMGLSVLVKLITLPLLGVFLLRELRHRRWREIAIAGGLLAAVGLVAYAPFWQGPEILRHHLGVAVGESGAGAGGSLRSLLLPAFALFTLCVGLTRRRDAESLIAGWVLVMLFFGLFMVRFYNAWYLTTLIAVSSLCRRGWLAAMAGGLSFSAFLFSSWYSTSNPGFPLPDLFEVERIVVFLAPTLGLGLVVAATLGLREQRRRAALRHATAPRA